MKMVSNARVALLAIALCTGAAAQADVLAFTGNATAVATALSDSATACTGGQFHSAVQPGNGTGTSSLGNFGYTSDTCVTPGGPVSGTFGITFATDGFQGTLAGPNNPTGTPGTFSPFFVYTILSGTGRFLNATGTFLGTGSIVAVPPPSRLTLQFGAVPEPATWAMMLLGFGGIGMAMRRSGRRGRALMQTA